MPYKNKEDHKKQCSKYYQENKERLLKRQKERIEERKKEDSEYINKRKAIYKKSYEKNKHKIQAKARSRRKEIGLRKYGLEEYQYDMMYQDQNEVCAICENECDANVPSSYKLVVDHDHNTNKVRGLLCHRCNKLLGMAKDDETILRRAIKYLKDAKSNESRWD